MDNNTDMNQELWLIGIANAGKQLNIFETMIHSKSYAGHTKLWRGADVSVVDINTSQQKDNHWLNNDIYIMTPFSRELSWAIYRLRDLFYEMNLLDYYSKYEFFGRLGDAAIIYHQRNGYGEAEGLLHSVSDEARKILKEMLKRTDHILS